MKIKYDGREDIREIEISADESDDSKSLNLIDLKSNSLYDNKRQYTMGLNQNNTGNKLKEVSSGAQLRSNDNPFSLADQKSKSVASYQDLHKDKSRVQTGIDSISVKLEEHDCILESL